MADVTWQPITVHLSALVPWDRNPKTISKTHAARLLDLWQRLGQFQTIAIGPAGEVYDGHQRLSVLKAAHGAQFEVTALQADRALTEKEREELTVAAHVGTTGQFNWDELSGWDVDELQTWGFDAETLRDWRSDLSALVAIADNTTWDDAFTKLPDEDRAPFQQMTFTLHDEQVEQVKRALTVAGKMGNFTGSSNQNSNGNALAFIAEMFMTEHGNGHG